MLAEHGERFSRAIDADFGGRSGIVSSLTEIVTSRAAIRHAKRHLKAWMKPRKASVSWTSRPSRAFILTQPLGAVGIIGPWNYPLLLLLGPLAGALAAGNRAMLKPSELTPAFAEVLKAAVAATFSEGEVAVITGDVSVAQAFAALPFDHLVFTGSTAVGRKVAEAAARNLTPVTLELGGKSPAIVDRSANLELAAERIAWGKLINSGQTCVAPDYALVQRDVLADFLQLFKAEVARQYRTFEGNPDYTSIINDRHFDRLNGLLEDARAIGGEVEVLGDAPSREQRIFPPAIIANAKPGMAVMQEEIFGPILPVIAYDTADDAIALVNAGDRPLSLYWFGTDKAVEERILKHTLAGGVTINGTILHLAQDGLPFGGVGASGNGHYHGEYGFRALSKEKPVFRQSRLSAMPLLYPPYGRLARLIIRLLNRLA
ncbi:coniferyl aldehyde dehydrogenase [Rhizobium sp. NRK18]|nr:coniferyl aldehyde dehydrogenase [Rhizobium sp. NRK18]